MLVRLEVCISSSRFVRILRRGRFVEWQWLRESELMSGFEE